MTNKKHTAVVVVGGNIGCGKSTLLSRMAARMQPLCPPNVVVDFQTEPVEEWTEWLTRFYSNPNERGNAFGLQVRVLLSFLSKSKKTTEEDHRADHNDDPDPHQWDKDANLTRLVVYERSPLDSVEVFGRVLSEAGQLASHEFALLQEFATHAGNASHPHVYVYLRCTPEVCAERVSSRDRLCEKSNISLDYLIKVHQAYENMIASLTLNTSTTAVVTVDVSDRDETNVVDVVVDKLLYYLDGATE